MVTIESLSAIYSGKKVFITGHTGFKGAWLMALLHTLGASVKGYALPPSYADGLFDSLAPLKMGESEFGDIRNRDQISASLCSYQPDFVFHLAAQPLVRSSYEKPTETFDINVTGTASVLEAVHRLSGPCTVVVVTTDKVYHNKEQHILYREDDPLGGYDPYSASKACSEILVEAFRSSFFNPTEIDRHHKCIATARAGNVIGGGDWSKDRIVPDIVRSLQANQTIEVRNPKAVRPWQHVLEPLLGYLSLAARLKLAPFEYSKAYNFGPQPEDHLTVRELVETAIDAWGLGNWQDASNQDQPHEAGLLKLSIERAIQELKWKPKLQAAEAIRWTIEWYKQPHQHRSNFTINQIHEYLSL
ncbi:CDP-glucose 4,6-dehydratase [Paraflavitalea sp. CAU 1676]|uniref:CDP-glucose 4,6-dehydratase n=1 Tax=Paraflavitalea sp. CAU 1676 TaxID=3032598 RepID=UPI0023D9997B|nr:CDP-glucose 4,6-dehydratase [Paraflavitalea sp. CAU 1676]